MKKLTFNIFYFVLGMCVLISVLFLYVKPSERLSLEAQPIDVGQKISHMLTNLKTEVVLTEEEIDSLIKRNFDPQLTKRIKVEGARFHIEQNQLYAKLNVMYGKRLTAELNASYHFNLSTEGELSLKPASLKLKDIPLPLSLLEPMQVQLYDMENSLIKITEVKNNARQLIIKWKLHLF